MEQENYFPKEYSLGEIFFEAWQKFKTNFRPILLITLIIYVPINIVLLFFSEASFKTYLDIMRLLEGVFGAASAMAIIYLIGSGQEKEAMGALKKSFSRLTAAIGTNILLTVFLIGLLLLLIVPGIIYSIYWLFTLYAVVLRDKAGKPALDYSKDLVKGRWWTVAWYNFAISAAAVLVGLTIGFFFAFLPDHYLVSLAMNTTGDVAASYFVVVWTVFFLNFEKTKIQPNDQII